MTRYTRIGITVGLILLLGVGAFFGGRHVMRTYSFAPDSPEQKRLAADHAQCTGLFVILSGPTSQKADTGAEKQHAIELEFHAKMGLNFSQDKELFKKQVESAISEISSEVIALNSVDKSVKLINEKTDACMALMFKSQDFILKKSAERTRG